MQSIADILKVLDIDISKFVNFNAIGESDFELEIVGRGFTSELFKFFANWKDQISLLLTIGF